MTEVLPLPTGFFGKSLSTEELSTLHAWPSVTPSMSVSSLTAAEQRDLQQISQFRERIEKEIEVRCRSQHTMPPHNAYCVCIGAKEPDKKNGRRLQQATRIRAVDPTC